MSIQPVSPVFFQPVPSLTKVWMRSLAHYFS